MNQLLPYAVVAALSAPVVAQVVVTQAQASYVWFTPSTSQLDSPAANFTANPSAQADVLFEQGWYYRIDADFDERAFRNDGTLTITNAGAHADADWSDVDGRGRLRALLDIDIVATGTTSGVVVQRMTIVNIGGAPVVVDLFHYVDVNLCGFAGNSVTGKTRQSITNNGQCPDTVDVASDADRWAIGPFAQDELGLVDGAAGDLPNDTTPFRGDCSSAFQWRRRMLEPGDSLVALVALAHNDTICAYELGFFGTASPGSGGRRARIGILGAPRLGTTASATLSGALPSANAVLNFGALPADLTVLGLRFLVDTQFFVSLPVVVDANGDGALPVPIPGDPALCGVTLYLQHLYIDAGAPNGLAASTRGMKWVIGSY